MKVQAIIPAGGMGARLQRDEPKVLIPIKGKPILGYTLEAFQQCSLIESIVLVAPKEHQASFAKVIQQYGLNKVKDIVPGGQTRRESVSEGLKRIKEETDIVVIHDGARPLVAPAFLETIIRFGFDCDAVTMAVPVKPTIKRVNPETKTVEETLRRELLWEIQTPQVFTKDIILKAHQGASSIPVTDDASLVERMGVKVKVFEGNYKNIKITTPEDLIMAEALLAET